MEKLNELRMTLIILLFGVFFISGCFFDKKYEVTFKTNGGSKVESITLKSGSTLSDLETPTKDGYKFIGWYVDGKPFDEETKIESDMTLVAKWEKIEIDYETDEEEDLVSSEEETTITTTTKDDEDETTTKKKTTTTRKKTTSTVTTTTTSKKVTTTTTTKPIEIDTTTTTTEVITVETTTASSTTTTTTNALDITTIPTSSLVQQPTTTTKVVNINISKVEELRTEVSEETGEEVSVPCEAIKISFDVDDELSNVESNITVEDYEVLINSDRKLWNIKSNTGYTYESIYDENSEIVKEFNLIGNKDVTTALSVYDGHKDYVFEYDTLLDKWFIKYPAVSLGQGLDQSYYANIETALKLAKSGDTISLLADIKLESKIVIDKLIHLDFNNYKVENLDEYLIEYKLIDSEEDIYIKDLSTEVINFMYINEDVKVNRIVIENSNITYSNTFKNESTLPIVLTNTTLSGLL